MTLDIGVMLPASVPGPDHPGLGDIRDSARFAEDVGLDSIWSTDHLIASAPILESNVVLATAAAVTERITIGFGVLLLALRPVAWTAKQISTLQHVSGNRVVLGVGTGNPAHGDAGWRETGVSFADRGRLTDEALRVLPGLVTGAASTLPDGQAVQLAPGAPMPPVLVAANNRRALRRAAEFGDGWISIGMSAAAVRAELAVLRDLAAEHGRPAPDAAVVGPEVSAEPARAAADLAAYAEAGVKRVILAPTGAGWQRDYEFASAVRAAL
ncbi:LLM class flavin-dependent oxidoreductase [Actinoalloteichus hymeniacidonis]|uniref:Coenzyme F420-dependent N5 N10-methylene tetrahydromethanopterin reductase-like protein n=1 Tax=Actinoalloteichus hymeniacidonis TaxID=340345 RepID=A0AAC9HQH2_9PSEU|nr:LLM class flavin-dependent oxidoreductase [Actinoalloteichus hymeniacidonis]AOS63458.1 Coenzyme F420-dependent N5 N10-methylene tetrahydromethanopterin reductase-like protein [Actinoalloteichus hymeniacidonis]MBB5908500.1 alkanesulfonate monooxygenase SsuD/methylene tetrahydromethanopterin reductase-like flavin-dependent oxidoreductase (luciferase family) [Actinoalloteichus hymeniacidonis]